MINVESENVLRKIIEIAPDGYKLFTHDDFNMEEVHSILNKLNEVGLIDLKYNLNDEYLLKLTSKGKEYFLEKNQQIKSLSLSYKRAFIASLLGSLLGALIVHVVIYIGGYYLAR